MAITGTGTKDDPYIVHNYDELKEKYTEQNRTSLDWYIKLVNDIDCNDFGDSWEWTAMGRGYGNKYIDLDNHTIKNIMIKSGSSLFSDNERRTYISNGKILNVFNNGAQTILNNVILNNISMSANGSNLTSYGFKNVLFEKCAVYFKSSKLNDAFCTVSSSLTCKNTDFYFDISDKNEQTIFSTNVNFCMLDNCRIQGIIGGSSDAYYLSNAYCTNSVIEVDTTNMTWKSNIADSSFKQPCQYTSTGIINTEISPILAGTSGLKACTTAQMRDPDYLNSIGFVIAKVGE